jgi:hypothetical protein
MLALRLWQLAVHWQLRNQALTPSIPFPLLAIRTIGSGMLGYEQSIMFQSHFEIIRPLLSIFVHFGGF